MKLKHRYVMVVVSLMLAGFTLIACGSVEQEVAVDTSPLLQRSPLATITLTPTAATPTPSPIRLVVLHTNDNWGETEPCG